jgi:hypothetical protein
MLFIKAIVKVKKVKWWQGSHPRRLFLAKNRKQLSVSLGCLLIVAILIFSFILKPEQTQAQILSQGPNSASATSDCTHVAGANVDWTNPGNAFSTNDTYATVSVDGTTSDLLQCVNFGFSIPSGSTITGVVVGIERKSSGTGNGGSNDSNVQLVKGGTAQGANRATTTTYLDTGDTYEDHGSVTDMWGSTLAPSDVNASNFGVALAVTKANAAGSAHTVSVDHMRITVYYEEHSLVSVTGYIWENDDEDNAFGDAYDDNTMQAAGNTAVSDVTVGERLTLRMQLKNTGSAALNDLALFYDRGDGVWTKVKNNTKPTTASGTGCASTDYSCTTIDGIGTYTSVALDSDGNPWLVYGDVNSLKVARYVGSGGNCDSSGGSDAWQCTTVNNAGAGGGTYPSIAISSSGIPWISFKDQVNDNLKVAKYVGSGGTGCIDTAWTCTLIDATNDVGTESSIAIDPNGTPWIAHRDFTDTSLKVAKYVGSGGNCDDTGGSDAWQCTGVDTGGFVGYEPYIAIDPMGAPWVSYAYNINDLRVARYVGTSGTGCADSAWTCTTIESSGDVGNDSSIAFDPAGNPWISHRDIANDDLRIARYVGSGGTGCASSAWTDCGVVDSTGDVGQNLSMVFGPGGNALISYYDVTEANLKLATYVGSGGNCDDTGGSDAWQCAAIDATNDVGDNSSLAVDSSGSLWISYYDTTNTNTKIAKLSNRMGEITTSASPAALAGNAINESHADMSSVSDTSNRDDADCSGGGTWNNGRLTTGEEISNLGLPIGSGTAQCTEVAFTIDTSNAIAGTTYRFAVATKDDWRKDKGVWRGPIAISNYPTLTISSTAASARYTKDIIPIPASACSHADWACERPITGTPWANHMAIAIDPDGNPWVATYDSTDANLMVSHYLGGATTGTGCAINTWSCQTLESTNDVGELVSIALGPDGNPWLAYSYSTGSTLKVARYLGGATTGTGCAINTWTCTTIDSVTTGASHTQIRFDNNGLAWIAYSQASTYQLKTARYVGTGGTGCQTSAWTCSVVDSGDVTGRNLSMALDSDGNPWVAFYRDAVTTCNSSPATECTLQVARYLGGATNGTGCTANTWTCTTIVSRSPTGSLGNHTTSIAINASGKVWVSYRSASGYLDMAEYLVGGTTGTGCTTNTWTCTSVRSSNVDGSYYLALDINGNPWIPYYASPTGSDLYLARYLGGDTSGTGCAITTWTCELIHSSGSVGNGSAIAFDHSGTPIIASRDNSNGDMFIARRQLPPSNLRITPSNNSQSQNAPRSDGRYHLSAGLSPRSTSSCSGVANLLGLCGIASDDSSFDGITATNGKPMFNFAVKNSSPASVPTITWIGRTNIAPNTASTAGDLVLQVYNHTTRAWETLATDSTSSDCNTVDCSLSGNVPGVQQYSYYEGDSSGSYWLSVRVWQYENASAETLKTDAFSTVFENTGSQLRGGNRFLNSLESGFDL